MYFLPKVQFLVFVPKLITSIYPISFYLQKLIQFFVYIERLLNFLLFWWYHEKVRNFSSLILTRKKKFLTRFLTRLARTSNLKITRLDPTRQSMTRLARDLNIFWLDPSLTHSLQTINKLMWYLRLCIFLNSLFLTRKKDQKTRNWQVFLEENRKKICRN